MNTTALPILAEAAVLGVSRKDGKLAPPYPVHQLLHPLHHLLANFLPGGSLDEFSLLYPMHFEMGEALGPDPPITTANGQGGGRFASYERCRREGVERGLQLATVSQVIFGERGVTSRLVIDNLKYDLAGHPTDVDAVNTAGKQNGFSFDFEGKGSARRAGVFGRVALPA